MLNGHRSGPRTALAAKLAAASVIGLITSGGIVAIAPASAAFAEIPHPPPPPTDPKIASATSAWADVLPPPTPTTVVIVPPGTGGDTGRKDVVIGGTGSD